MRTGGAGKEAWRRSPVDVVEDVVVDALSSWWSGDVAWRGRVRAATSWNKLAVQGFECRGSGGVALGGRRRWRSSAVPVDEDEVVDVQKAEAQRERRAWIFGSATLVGEEAAGLAVLGIEDSRCRRGWRAPGWRGRCATEAVRRGRGCTPRRRRGRVVGEERGTARRRRRGRPRGKLEERNRRLGGGADG